MVDRGRRKMVSIDTRSKRMFAVFILVIGVLFVALLLRFEAHAPRIPAGYDAVLTAGSIDIPVTIADTEKEREQGLSDTVSLPQNAGKFFVFDTPSNYGFWMKDMHYPLDIIWINSDFTIVTVIPNIAPDTYPEAFYPTADAQYVLEVNAGFAAMHGIKVGGKFILKR